MEMLECHSGVSMFTGDPFVMIQWGTKTAQVDVETAREIGLQFLEVAEASVHDAALRKILVEKANIPEEVTAQLINDLRNYRKDKK